MQRKKSVNGKTFGKILLTDIGLSQKDLCKKLAEVTEDKIEVTQQLVSKWRTGACEIRLCYMEPLRKALGFSMDKFYGKLKDIYD